MKKTLFFLFFLIGISAYAQNDGGGSSSSISKNNLSKNNQNNAILESLGGFTAQAMYNTYAVIGMAADAYAKGTYEAEMVKQLLQEQITFIDNLTKQVNKLLASKTLTPTDNTFFKDVVKTYTLLKNEASAYKSYIENSDDSYLSTFSTNREQAWAKISELLGLGN